MNKQTLIAEFLEQPIKPGDLINIKGYSSQNKETWGATTVLYVDDMFVFVAPPYNRGKKLSITECQAYPIQEVKRDISHIGVNPFKPEIRLKTYAYTLQSALHHVGYDYSKGKLTPRNRFGDQIIEANFNPYIFKDNKKYYYQRDYVWSLEQKQCLIDSIYNNIEIGKFVVRARSYDWVEKQWETTKEIVGYKEIVDGKQRLNALITFISGQFADSYGNYFSDLSTRAQNKFMNYMNFAFCELEETATDNDVIDTFLAINHLGAPQSKEHIEFVKSIKLG